MNERFVTEAIQNDRCLKAHRLLERFETELRAELKRVGKEMVESNPHLFPDDVEVGSNSRIEWDSGTIIANARDNIELARVTDRDPPESQRLNISVRWVDPIDWGEEGVDGALCAACYKINDGARNDFERVKRDTVNGDWDLHLGDDQFNNAPGIFYVPVASADELREANDTLIAHFAEFGDYWGVEPTETDTGD